MLIATSHQIREADRIQIEERHVPGILLMEQAGQRATERLLALYPGQQSFLILAGPGNNGGDGLVMARYLSLAGYEVQVLLSHTPDRYVGDANIQYTILAELPVPLTWVEQEEVADIIDSFSQAPVLIDALLGTGLQAALREPVASLIHKLAAYELPVVAIDLPSGLQADSGQVISEPLRAAHTLTFQLPKLCHYITPAATYCGLVEVLDIGIWPEVINQLKIQRETLDDAYYQRHRQTVATDAHKGTQGHALLVGGSQQMAGAMVLSAYSSLRMGAGLSTVLAPEGVRQTLLSHVPEAMCLSSGQVSLGLESLESFDQALRGKQAVGIGPGLGQSADVAAFLEAALPMIQVPLVLDADALNALAAHPAWWTRLPDHTILTPHPGEMRRLTGIEQVQERRLEIAESLAHDRQVIVVLKGAGTIVALPDGRSFVNRSGNAGMATAGAGDVLTGVIVGLLAQGYAPEIAATLGVYLHGLAGDRVAAAQGQAALMAMDLAKALRL